jgi:hypothetical protein
MNRYEQLTYDLKEAYKNAMKASTEDDSGTFNLDCTFLILKGWQERKVLKIFENVGLHCSGKTKWVGYGYLLNTGQGQASRRTRVRDAFAKVLKEKGYNVVHFNKMD